MENFQDKVKRHMVEYAKNDKELSSCNIKKK
jgi:hypothetical protein